MADPQVFAETDPLTGLSNRRAFFRLAGEHVLRSAARNEPLSLLMIDIDKFKAINDTHGHAAGDDIIANLAATLRESIRQSDIACRFGGEEFVCPARRMRRAGGVPDRRAHPRRGRAVRAPLDPLHHQHRRRDRTGRRDESRRAHPARRRPDVPREGTRPQPRRAGGVGTSRRLRHSGVRGARFSSVPYPSAIARRRISVSAIFSPSRHAIS